MPPGYFPVFFWSLLILGSFWGYGELLRRRINRPEFADIGWGLTCAWVKQGIQWIEDNHDLPRIRPKGYRRLNCKSFPYADLKTILNPALWFLAGQID